MPAEKVAVEFDVEGAVRHFMSNMSLGIEAISYEAWAWARQNHPFKNRTGQAEASIRIQSKYLGPGVFKWRIAGGGPINSEDGWKSKPKGTPGGPKSEYEGRANYFVYLEFGTKRMPAFPTLRPAVAAQRGALRKLRGVLGKTAARRAYKGLYK